MFFLHRHHPKRKCLLYAKRQILSIYVNKRFDAVNRNKFPAEEWVVCMNEIFIGFKSIMNYLTAA